MIDYFKALFQRSTVEMLALQELEDAKRKLLEAQTGFEYAKHMVSYNKERVIRLTEYLHNIPKEENLSWTQESLL